MALTGKLSETPFTDLIQFYAASRQTVAVTVNLPDGQGEDGVFYLEDGEVVDAFLGDAVGREAVRRAMLLGSGSFRIEPDLRAAERTITEPLHQLLLTEGTRLDGERAGRGDLEAAPSPMPAPPGGVSLREEGAKGIANAQVPGRTQADPGVAAESRLVPGAARPRRGKPMLLAAAAVLVLLVGGGVYLRCGAARSARGAPGSTVTVGDPTLAHGLRVVPVTPP